MELRPNSTHRITEVSISPIIELVLILLTNALPTLQIKGC